MTVALLGFLAAFVLIFARVPVAVALMSVGTAGIWMTYGAKMALASMALDSIIRPTRGRMECVVSLLLFGIERTVLCREPA